MALPVLDLWFGPPDEHDHGGNDAPHASATDVRESLPLTPRDADLLTRLRHTDADIATQALAELHTTWAASLARYAERLVRSPDVADDIVQDVFVSLWNRRAALPTTGAPRAYLFGAVHRRALQWLRHGRVTKQWADRVAAEIIATPDVLPTAPTRPDATIEVEELAALLRTTVDALAPRQREALLLYREQELSLTEVAQVMGISINTVKVQVQRAGARLRAVVEAYLS